MFLCVKFAITDANKISPTIYKNVAVTTEL